MTIAEKILAAKSGRSSVTPGEIVEAYPDLVMSHTATWRSVSVMQRIGATRLYDPDRLAIVLDHISPAKTEKYAADQQISRNFARQYGIRKFYDIDAGIAHLVLMEAGHVAPGDLIVGTDSHCTIYGSLGALGTGIGYTEVTSVWITGKLWMKVPESIKITLRGRFAAGVYAKDLMLHLIGKLPAVILPGLVTAFGVFWMTQYLESALPYELIEAARVDGASMIRTFFFFSTLAM